MFSKKPEADTINDSVVWSHSDESYSGHGTAQDTLIQSGKFVRKGESIEFSPDYVSALFASYPETAIYEALSRGGFTTGEIGSLDVNSHRKRPGGLQENLRFTIHPSMGAGSI